MVQPIDLAVSNPMTNDFDSLLIVPFDARRNLVNFTREIIAMWPAASMNLFDETAAVNTDKVLEEARYPEHGAISYARDAEMEEHWDTYGYMPMADGAGPIYLLYNVRRNLHFGMDVNRIEGNTDENYLYWKGTDLLLPEATSITLVTCGNPAGQPFCSEIWSKLKGSLRPGR